MPVDRTMFFNWGSRRPTLIDSHAQVESQAWGPELVNRPTPSDCIHSVTFYCSAPQRHPFLGEIAFCVPFDPIYLLPDSSPRSICDPQWVSLADCSSIPEHSPNRPSFSPVGLISGVTRTCISSRAMQSVVVQFVFITARVWLHAAVT